MKLINSPTFIFAVSYRSEFELREVLKVALHTSIPLSVDHSPRDRSGSHNRVESVCTGRVALLGAETEYSPDSVRTPCIVRKLIRVAPARARDGPRPRNQELYSTIHQTSLSVNSSFVSFVFFVVTFLLYCYVQITPSARRATRSSLLMPSSSMKISLLCWPRSGAGR